MSYILDALKKSDEQRMASLNEKPVQLVPSPATHRSGMGWFTLLAIACLIAGGWLFTLFQQDHSPSQTVPQSDASATSTVRNMPKPVMPVPQSEHRPAPRPLPKAAMSDLPSAHAEKKFTTTQPIPPAQGPAAPATPVPPAEPRPVEQVVSPESTAPSESILRRADLPVGIQQGLPPIHIEGHIYDADPASRMVIINGHVLHEGQTIEGLRLESITEHGIILNAQGTRFSMGVFDH